MSLWVEMVLEKQGRRDGTNQCKTADAAARTVTRIARLPSGLGFEARARLIETDAIPTSPFPMEHGLPSDRFLGRLTSLIMST